MCVCGSLSSHSLSSCIRKLRAAFACIRFSTPQERLAMWKAPSPTEASQSPLGAGADFATAKTKNPGRRFAQVIKLKKECLQDYKRCHANIWPEVAKQIKDCGIIDCEWFCDESTPSFCCTHEHREMQIRLFSPFASLFYSLFFCSSSVSRGPSLLVALEMSSCSTSTSW